MPSVSEQMLSDGQTEIFPVRIGGRELAFHKPNSIDRFIDPDNPMKEFPLWAKIWEASIVLMQYMADLPVDPERRILELGSGLGVAGITAAALGHDITLTEYDTDALTFLQANASKNDLGHLSIHRLDWFDPQMEGTFDLIIGSEIVYQESAVTTLAGIFEKHLDPEGKIVLAERARPTGAVFFETMAERYDIRVQQRTLRSREKSEKVALFELSSK